MFIVCYVLLLLFFMLIINYDFLCVLIVICLRRLDCLYSVFYLLCAFLLVAMLYSTFPKKFK